MFTVLYGSKSFVLSSELAAKLLKRAAIALRCGLSRRAEALKAEAVYIEKMSQIWWWDESEYRDSWIFRHQGDQGPTTEDLFKAASLAA